MDFYNTIPSGPSSRPYNNNNNSSLSPTFPSYPLMTESYDPNRPTPHQIHTANSLGGQRLNHHHQQSREDIQDDRFEDEEGEQEQDQEQEQEQEHDQEREQEQDQIEYDDSLPMVEPHQSLDSFLESFWTRQMSVVERDNPDFRTYPLPLARIKKVMKSDEEVKVSHYPSTLCPLPSTRPLQLAEVGSHETNKISSDEVRQCLSWG